ncbi:dodecin family protein [Alphaproteobacteria bacterium]|nr:dodecin family protein [Alphaproteobacteria bacterium]
MAIMKVVEIMADSSKSWEDATRRAVREASKSIKNIRSVWVKDQSCGVEDGEVTRYRVTVKISFEVDR